jgi:hypothetical protein
MNVEFRFGPKDGKKKFLPFGRSSETILVEFRGNDYIYRKTKRRNEQGMIIYQFIGLAQEVVEV